MALYNLLGDFKLIKETPFKYEKEIQSLIESNLQSLLKLDYIRSEFSHNNFRVDTLAFDNESKSFVIIEFKREKNFSVIDQGYAYLSLMLNNKADFILEYNERKDIPLKRSDVDWTQSKVIFISPHFTTYQKEAINFKDLPIELWEIKKYENNTISFNQLQKTYANESIKTISNKETVKNVSNEVVVYTEEAHLIKTDFETKELYESYKEGILNLEDNIELNPKKHYIGFKIDGNTFCDIVFQNKTLKIFINLKYGELNDGKDLARDVSNIGHWGNGAYEIKVSDTENLEYILSLIKQSLRKNKG
ncbi:hypothetical protein DVK85_10415 [Flavobacterium arcticum]|uniref:DUF5655 domain-containing protein n=1 Tax=Flavobacterium arcticum TaxID=1784713 RepID=A0A345HDG4_9FLAO|nr:DUF5655 domain-containing protein [Flavobacterium arcticum]AXG74624.1 hypothetical protein DVK85_10415 [Flavobacterium arcticum]KAF2512252.1 hypothetical protein E0W72_03250 [Flavobacterium arcticum]